MLLKNGTLAKCNIGAWTLLKHLKLIFITFSKTTFYIQNYLLNIYLSIIKYIVDSILFLAIISFSRFVYEYFHKNEIIIIAFIKTIFILQLKKIKKIKLLFCITIAQSWGRMEIRIRWTSRFNSFQPGETVEVEWTILERNNVGDRDLYSRFEGNPVLSLPSGTSGVEFRQKVNRN